MKKYLSIVLIVSMSCSIDFGDEFELPWTNRIVVLKGSRTINNNPSNLDFELDMIVLQAKIFSSLDDNPDPRAAIDDIIKPYPDLLPTAFDFNILEGETYDFSVSALNQEEQPVETDEALSIGVLLDISDPSYKGGFGFNNYYIEGLIGMIKLADPKHEFLLAKYRREFSNDPAMRLITPNFTTYSDDLAVQLSKLPDEAKDFASLYDGIYEMINQVADKANNSEKHLIVFSSSLDNGSVNGITVDDIIQRALARNVKISVVWDPEDGISNWHILAKIPMLTGGFSAYDAYGITGGSNTFFLSAIDIINNKIPYYTMSANISDINNSITSPFDYRNYVTINVDDQNTDGIGSSFVLNFPLIYHIE